MRNMMITIFVIVLLIGTSIFLVYTTDENSPEDVMIIFLEDLLSATPEKQIMIYDIDRFDVKDIETYVYKNYTDIATQRMLDYLMRCRELTISSELSLDSNSNINVEDIKITYTQESDGKVYFNFEGRTRLVDSNTLIEYIYPFTGQIGLKDVEGKYKVDTLRFFTITLYRLS